MSEPPYDEPPLDEPPLDDAEPRWWTWWYRWRVPLAILGGLALLIALLLLPSILARNKIDGLEGDVEELDKNLAEQEGQSEALREGLDEANRMLVQLGEQPVPVPPPPGAETNDPDPDDPDPNDPDPNDPEIQDSEIQDPEVNDPDPFDDPDVNDLEFDDPEIQDPEIQDPEIDDPDPNDLAPQCPDGSVATRLRVAIGDGDQPGQIEFVTIVACVVP